MDKNKNLKILLKEDALKTEYGILASEIKDEIKVQNIPEQIRDEIPTLNKMGYMKLDLDYFSSKFVDYSCNTNEPVMELGCAYGVVIKKILAKKQGKVIACDLDEEHLKILIKSCNNKELENLYIYPGNFPEDINIPDNSLGAIFTSRMFHFLDGNTIEKGLDKIYKWLKPGGKLFFIVVTPHNSAIKKGCLSVYRDNVSKNVQWPGVIENQWEINPYHKDFVGPYLHVFDKPELEKLLSKHGFGVNEIDLFDFPNEVDSENKGHVGLIATKI